MTLMQWGMTRAMVPGVRMVLPRRAVVMLAMMGMLTVLPLARFSASAQTDRADDLNAKSPAGAHAEVIAQGIGAVSGDEMAWRLVEDTAEAVGEANYEERALGFAVATNDALLLTDESDGARALLATRRSRLPGPLRR